MHRSLFYPLFALVGLIACSSPRHAGDRSPLSLRWEIVSSPYLATGQTLAALTLVNPSSDTLGATGWSIHFNAGGLQVADSDTAAVAIELVNGDFFTLYPKAGWTPLAPGDSVRVQVLSRLIKNHTDMPKGFYLVSSAHPEGLSLPFDGGTLPHADSLELAIAARVYRQNGPIVALPLAELPPVLPTPASYRYTADSFLLESGAILVADSAFGREAQYLRDELAKVLDRAVTIGDPETPGSIVLRKRTGDPAEGYTLTVAASGVTIEASTPAGAFYGIQSLKNLLPPSSWKAKRPAIQLPGVNITDKPRFGHRAVMLDVSRNFQTKEQVMKILDVLALYKVNVLHFHLNEDEAWRLEIPGLPELTEVGAKRGHTLDDSQHLVPSYGSGPSVDNATGSGFYSRADYIELLKYAAVRHMRVIPEIETPGHARAAIKSMDARYARFMAAGDTAAARQYLLRDREDQSVYRSIQHWDDNVINVALPSTYAFLEKVVDELIAMHAEAEAPLATIHFGGDEVPNGVWERSPAVHRLLAADASIPHVDDLWHYYFTRIDRMLKSRGLYLSGWEEIGMKKAVVGGKRQMVVEPRFGGSNFHVDVWNNLGSNADLAYRLANAGYQVVLTNVTNFYFDLAYNESFHEPGQYWGGYVDIEKPFRFVPYDYYRSLETNVSGERLSAFGRSNIVGLQAPLWSEIITTPERMEYLLLPKLFGLAERAWAADPQWATETDEAAASKAYARDWSAFLTAVAQRELPRLDHYGGGYGYRIPTAGVAQQDGKLHANVQLPGFVIRYTTDGSEPDGQSTVYEQPIAANATVAFRVFNAEGRGGRTVYWKTETR